MSVDIVLLAALQRPPRERSFTVSGIEKTNLYGRNQAVPFEFRLLKPELLGDASPGDTLYIEARVQPTNEREGEVLIIPSLIQVLGNVGSILNDHGYTRQEGFQRVTVQGNIVSPPDVKDFGGGLYGTSLHVDMNSRHGQVRVVAYGEAAQKLGNRQPGDRLLANGRLVATTTTDPRGRETVQYSVELERQDIELAADYKARTERQRNARTGPQSTRPARSEGRAAAPKRDKPQPAETLVKRLVELDVPDRTPIPPVPSPVTLPAPARPEPISAQPINPEPITPTVHVQPVPIQPVHVQPVHIQPVSMPPQVRNAEDARPITDN